MHVRPYVLIFSVLSILLLTRCGEGDKAEKQLSFPPTEVENVQNRPQNEENNPETRALVLYNILSQEGSEVAQYYAFKRNIPETYLCPVRIRTGLIGRPSDILSLRKQIIEGCLCPNFASGEQCSETNISVLLNRTDLPSHLVITKGIPSILKYTPWGSTTNSFPLPLFAMGENASFDYYLSYSILNQKALCTGADCLFGENSNGLFGLPWYDNYSPSYRRSFGPDINYYLATDSGEISSVQPTQHKAFAYARLESLSLDGTKKLIDRTLKAEREGLTGNLYTSGINSGKLKAFSPVWFGDRTKWNSSGGVPVAPQGEIRSVVRPMAFFGTDPMWELATSPHMVLDLGVGQDYVQSGFVGDPNRFRSWKQTDGECKKNCSDFSTLEEVEACKTATADPFQIVNTACNGVNEGFFGIQLRSFPVQYMGVYAPGWNTVGFWSQTVDPMNHSMSGGFQNGVFTDSRYVYFGDPYYRRTSGCDTSISACDPMTEIFTYRDFALPSSLSLSQIHLSYAYKGYAAQAGRVAVEFAFMNGETEVLKVIFNNDLDGEIANWETNTSMMSLTTPPSVIPNRLRVSIYSPSNGGYNSSYASDRKPLAGYFAIDGIQASAGNVQLIDTDAGSFNQEYDYSNPNLNYFNPGDWAGHIFRLGGTGWSGSLSHFYLGGVAFGDYYNILNPITRGRTFGEAHLWAGWNFAAIVYGDPLYSPFKASLSMDPALFEKNGPLANTSLISNVPNLLEGGADIPTTRFTVTIKSDSPVAIKTAPLYFSAGFGDQGNYDVSYCFGSNIKTCDWHLLTSGSGKVERSVVPGTEGGLLPLAVGSGTHIFRVRSYPGTDSSLGVSQYAAVILLGQEIPIQYMFSKARLMSDSWNIYQREYGVAGSLMGNSTVWQSNVNVLQVVCNNSEAFCDPAQLTLSGTTASGLPIPAYTRTILNSADLNGSPEIRVQFRFQQPLRICDRYSFVLTSSNGRFSKIMANYIPGDFDGNGIVDNADFLSLRINYQRTGGSFDEPLENDMNVDYKVDSSDFLLFRMNFLCHLSVF